MKRVSIVLTIMILLFSGCGGNKDRDGKPDAPKAQSGKPEKPAQEKSELPPRLQQAVKAGRISAEQARQIMARTAGGGDKPLVRLGTAARGEIRTHLVLNGTVEPERSVDVYARLAAYVKEVVREEGSRVNNGDILARLDDTEISISHQQARIQLEQARLTLEEEKNNFQRNQELKENELISEMDFQASEARYRQARLEYENKTENFKNLDLQLNYTRIRAPVSGFVTQRLIEVGDRVTANQHVYTVEDFSPLLIRVFVPAADIGKLQSGMNAEISSDTLPGRAFTGRIKLINPRIDVQSGTVKVTIEVNDSSLTLKPGMFVEVNIVTRSRQDALIVPRTAVLYQRNQVLVFLFQDGKAVATPVTVGVTEDDRVEITDGLKEGDTIIVQGAEVLKDGAEVNVLK